MPAAVGEPTMPLGRFAAVTALIDAGRARDEVLDAAALSREAWTEAQAGWLFKMAQQARLKRFELQNRFNDMLVEHLEALHRGESVEIGDGCLLDAPPQEREEIASPSPADPPPVPPSSEGTSAPVSPLMVAGHPAAPPSPAARGATPPGPATPEAATPEPGPPGPTPPGAAPPVEPRPAAPPMRADAARATTSRPATMPPAGGVASRVTVPLAAVPFAGSPATPFSDRSASSTDSPPAVPRSVGDDALPFGRVEAHVGSTVDITADLLPYASERATQAAALPFSKQAGGGTPTRREGAGSGAGGLPFTTPAAPAAGLPFGPGAPAGSGPPVASGAPAGSGTRSSSEGGGADRGLPFTGSRRSPPPSEVVEASPRDLGLTMDAASAGAGASLPFASGEPSLTVEQFASLETEMSLAPEREDEIRGRYGLDAERHDAERAVWARRLLDEPATRARYQQVKRDYKAWLTSRG